MLYDLFLTGTLLAAAPPESAFCSEYARHRAQALEHARDHLWPGAARQFLALWRECKRDPRDLHNAATSYFSDGHKALALQLWRELHKLPGLDSKLRGTVAQRIQDATAQTVPVALRFDSLQSANNGVIEAYREPGRIEVEAAVTADLELRLDPGHWTVAYTVRDHRSERKLELTDAPPDALVFAVPAAPPQVVPPPQPATTPSPRAAPTPPPAQSTPRPVTCSSPLPAPSTPSPATSSQPDLPPAPRSDRTAPILLGVGMGVSAVGLGVTLHQSSHHSAILDPDKDCPAACNAEIARSLDQRDAGAALLGSGLALALTGATARTRNPQYRTGVAIGETALGGVLAVVGLAARFVALGQEHELAATPLADADAAHWQRLATLAMADTVVAGVGFGLAVGGATKLIVQRARTPRERRVKLGALMTRDALGLQLRGNF